MKRLSLAILLALAIGSSLTVWLRDGSALRAGEQPAAAATATEGPDEAAVQRSRKTAQMLDSIYKQTIVLITDKYVHDETDFAAGSAAVLLFSNISKQGSHQVRLIDATGEPYEPANVARDAFEKEGLRRLKSGESSHEQVVRQNGAYQLRVLTPVPVVLPKCVMCHEHYGDVKAGEPIGAISYTIPIE